MVTNGFRPEIKSDLPNCYRKLIEKCWSQDPSERPTFEEIVELLKTDKEFITSNIDHDEFWNYIEYLEENYSISNRVHQNDSLDSNLNQEDKTKYHVKAEQKMKESFLDDNSNHKICETDFDDE